MSAVEFNRRAATQGPIEIPVYDDNFDGVASHAKRVFGENAEQWLTANVASLGGRTPLSLALSGNFKRLNYVLHSIEHGLGA